MSAITAERLKELYVYEPETGLFSRLAKGRRRKVGTVTSRGYIRIGISSGFQYAHRLAWLYVHGKWPAGVIDHINCNPSDNRISNLRDVPLAGNAQNERASRPNNKTGLLGVTKCSNADLYFARITVSGVVRYLGCFETAKAAHETYVRAKRSLHPYSTL